MINESQSLPNQHCHTHAFQCISWSAIFVGALVALGLSFLLNLFGIAIGLSAFTVNKAGATTIAMGGLIGIFIGVIVSMLVAGYAAGYLGRVYCSKHNLGILYGFTTWSLALLLCAAIAIPISNYVSTYTHHISGTVVADSSNAANNIVKVETTPTTNASQRTEITASPSSLAGTAFIIFALFFVGAVATCIGACWAMKMCCLRDHSCNTRNRRNIDIDRDTNTPV